jgi:hypothetical protein
MRPSESGSPTKKAAPALPKTLGGPIADAIRQKVKSGLNIPGKVTKDRVERSARYGKDAVERGSNTTGGGKPNLGPRPTVGKVAPEQTPRKPVYGKDAVERGSNTTGGGKPTPKVGPFNSSPDRIDKSGKGPVPNAGRNPDRLTPKGPGKPDPVPGPGKRPVKPAPTPTVYRAKKGDGLWQVAEKTVPAGTSTSAWWAKIKKLNSTNGKVNRTYTGTGVKLPKG